MHSIKTKITAMTVCVIVIAMVIAAVYGVTAIRDVGNHDADQTLLLLMTKNFKPIWIGSAMFFRNWRTTRTAF